MKLGIYRTGWKQFNLVNLCVDIQRVFSFVRINCDPVFSNGCFEAKKTFGLVFASGLGKLQENLVKWLNQLSVKTAYGP